MTPVNDADIARVLCTKAWANSAVDALGMKVIEAPQQPGVPKISILLFRWLSLWEVTTLIHTLRCALQSRRSTHGKHVALTRKIGAGTCRDGDSGVGQHLCCLQ